MSEHNKIMEWGCVGCGEVFDTKQGEALECPECGSKELRLISEAELQEEAENRLIELIESNPPSA